MGIRSRLALAAVSGCFAWLTVATTVTAQSLTAKEIIQRADELTRGRTAQGKYTMTIVRPDWQRSMTFDYWSEGTEKSFIRVLEPAKERGVSFLKVGREMWQYVPRINRVIKIPPSMMLQSWMGSDFTNDDLVHESSIVDDYEHRLLAHEEFEGHEAYQIELIPKPSAAVAWDRLVEWIRVDDFVPLRAEYFNERGERVRTMLFSNVREMGGREIPARMELIEEKKEGRRTILDLEDVRFDERIPGSVFTQQNLRRPL
ncbi:MAG: outer membrane lipoprotein-sorting protein [Rhodothermales bacterium]|nr:outer membrane lipoprotein-sorting protein [Rhodothermales bacterium]